MPPTRPTAGVGDDDVADHLPGGHAHARRRFAQHHRHGQEHVAGDRGDEGQHHDRQHDAGGQHADAIGRAAEQQADPRQPAQRADQQRLHMGLQERRQHEEAPEPVDDAGNAGQKLDGDAEGAAQAFGADLGEEHRDAQADRHADHHGDGRGDEGAVDRRQRAEDVLGRAPALGPQEGRAEAVQMPARRRSPATAARPPGSPPPAPPRPGSGRRRCGPAGGRARARAGGRSADSSVVMTMPVPHRFKAGTGRSALPAPLLPQAAVTSSRRPACRRP